MARIIAALLCIASIATLTACATNANAGITAPAVQNAIASAVERDRQLYGGKTPVPGVVISIWDKNGNHYYRGFGYADVAKRRPQTIADHFRIGSNTKTFTVAVILQLVDEGKLSLDDPVSKFNIGVKVPNGDHITVRELCNMRSGIFEAYNTPEMSRYVPSRGKVDTHQIVRWALAQKPYFAPDQGYHYTNTGYLMLGFIIEAVTHHSVAYEVETRLIKPFELSQTSVPASQAMPEPYAHGYSLSAKGVWEDVSDPGVPVQFLGPAGDMISDVNDIHRWIIDYVTGKVSKPATFRALMECKPTAKGSTLRFGLGLACAGGDWFGYTGGLPGYNTADYYNVKNGLFVLAWVQSQIDKPRPGVANAIARDVAKVISSGPAPFEGAHKGI